MTPAEAKKLRVGARVRWESSGELGTVIEKGEAGVRVKWEDAEDEAEKTVATYLFAAVHCGLLHIQVVAP